MLDSLSSDLRQGLRSLATTPLVSSAAIVCLAGAIGAATAVFTIVDGVVLRSLPFENADRLVAVWGVDPGRDTVLRGFSWLDAQDIAQQTRSLEGLAVIENANGGMTLTGRGDPAQLPSRTVSGNFFDILGVRAAMGRALTAGDDDLASAPVVVLSDALWRSRFGGDPAIVGAALMLDGRPFTVAGVMPRSFSYPRGAQFWVTVAHSNPDLVRDRTLGWLEIVGLARPGATPPGIRTDLTGVFDQITKTHRPTRGPQQLSVIPLQRELLGDVRSALWAVFAAVLILLAVACANVGGLLLIRGSARAHEIAVRVALGAERRHILRQALAESMILAVTSGAIGFALAVILVGVTKTLAPGDIPRLADITINPRILTFTIGVVFLTIVVCALAPASQASTANIQALVANRGRTISGGRTWLGRVLAASEVALSVVLLVSAGLVGRTFLNLSRLDVGFLADRVLAFAVPVPAARYSRPEDHRRLNDELLARLSVLPGVRHAAAVLLRPLWGRAGLDWPVTIEGQAPADAANNPLVNLEPISTGYFETLGIPLIAGRDIGRDDRDGRPGVAVVGRSFARRFWPGDPENAVLGRRLRFPLPGSSYSQQWFTVVGIVGDAKYRGLRTDRLDLYMSDAQGPYPAHQFVVRTDGDPAVLVGAIRAEVRAIDRDLPIDDVTVLGDAVEQELANPRFTARVFAAFGLVALGLAALGIGTLISWQARQRTREIGIRIALGATSAHVVRLVMTDSAVIICAGVAAGLGIAAATTAALRTLLFNVSPADPTIMAGAVATAALAGLASAYFPARRASRADPLVAVRTE